ncbi:MAG: VIT family protein [Patescibacteria group bacterium]|nr:VIT family protein [Patescibacteria group bacterium]
MKKEALPAEIVHHSKEDSHEVNHTAKLNWLRASVLGADDGIVSIAGLVVGVAGATNHQGVILAAGLAGIIAGAISMAAGEYISVSSSRDTEKVLLEKERYELAHFPQAELEELACIYEKKGLSKETAMKVAKELSAKDAARAHFDAELGIDPDNLTDPWHAAFASAAAFTVGAIIPLIAILLPPISLKVPVTFFSVLVALFLTGILSAKISGASIMKSTVRVVLGGAFAMIVTYSIGRLFGIKGI